MRADDGPRKKKPPRQRRVNLADAITQAVEPAVKKAKQVERTHPRYAAEQSARKAVQRGAGKVEKTVRKAQRQAFGKSEKPRSMVGLSGSGKAKTKGGGIGPAAINIGDIAGGVYDLPNIVNSRLPGIARLPLQIGTAISNPAAAITSLGPINSLVKNAVSDSISLPQGFVLGGYELGAGASEALQEAVPGLDPLLPGKGSYARGKKIVSSLDDGALGRLLVHGDIKGAAEAAYEHPLYTTLDIAGASQVIGRTAGAGARAGVLGSRARKYAQLPRAPVLADEGSAISTGKRRYSANLGVQALQKRADAKRTVNGEIIAKPGRERTNIINRAVDEAAHQFEGRRQYDREMTIRAVAQAKPKSKSVAGVVFHAVEGKLDPTDFKGSLQRELKRLDDVYEANKSTMRGDARSLNRQTAKAIRKVLDDPKALTQADEVFKSAREYTKRANAVEDEAIRLLDLDKDQALAAKVRPYAVSQMGAKAKASPENLRKATALEAKAKALAKSDPEATRRIASLERRAKLLREPDGLYLDGRKLTAADVVQHLSDNNVPMPGFVTHKRGEPSARAFFENWLGNGRKSVTSNGRRTGKATELGTHRTDYQALVEGLVGHQGKVSAMQSFDKFVGQFGRRKPNGKAFTWDEAQHFIEEQKTLGGPEMTAVRLAPSRLGDDAVNAIMDRQGSPNASALEGAVNARIESMLKTPDNTSVANVVVVDSQALKRFRAHQLSNTGIVGKASGVVTGQFRNTVLPFSTKWMFGNAAEAVVRMALNGVTPVDLARGHMLMRALRKADLEAFAEAETRLRSGLMYGSARRLTPHRDINDFKGTKLEGAAKAVVATRDAPVLHYAFDGIGVMQRGAFALNKALVERQTQTAVIGKLARQEAQDLAGHWTKALGLQRKVMDEVARGLTNTDTQIRFAREMDDILGKYGRFSPTTRKIIQTTAPFLPWYLNAAKFSLYTLPVKHPLKASLMAHVEQAFAQDWEDQHGNLPPGDLRWGIVRKDGGVVNLSRFTPFGLLTSVHDPESALQEATSVVLPQVASVFLNIYGQNFAGRNLRVEDGEPSNAAIAAYSLVESVLPGIAIARRLREGGSTAWDDSTVFSPKTKPNTKRRSGPDRVFNPLSPTYVTPKVDTGPVRRPRRRARTVEDELRDIAGEINSVRNTAADDTLREIAAEINAGR